MLIRLLTLSSASALFAAVLLTAAPNSAGAAETLAEHCKHSVSLGLFEIPGKCMKLYKTSKIDYCNLLKNNVYYDLPDAGFKNHGDCMTFFKDK